MQNDMLKNNIAPWQEQGRWYHAVVHDESGTLTIVNEKSDKFIIDNFGSPGGYIIVAPNNYYILDVIIKIPLGNTATSSWSKTIYRLSNGSTGFTPPSGRPSVCDMEFWVFITK